MICPCCSSEMTAVAVDARLGAPLTIDLCPASRAIWFDRFEDLQLSPAATLKIFGMISEQSNAAAAPWPGAIACPRCGAGLLYTHDIQRNTKFQYWRCDAGHGRLMSFIDFLRVKDFVRPLTPQQIAELRQNVQTINCSNCGGGIDLAKDTVCTHCGSAVSMLDLKQMAKTIGQLQAAAAGPQAIADAEAARASAPPRGADLDALIAAIRARGGAESRSLIETGFSMLGDLLRMKL
jgi:hypothetical protein